MAVLREPTLRAYSNWADLREQGREKLDFASAMAAEEERRRLDWEPFWLYRELGLYGQQLTRLFTVFPRRAGQGPPGRGPVRGAPTGRSPRCSPSWASSPWADPLEDERLNQTMYKPVDRRSRLLETLFEQGQRARPAGPAPRCGGWPARWCAGDCAPRRRRDRTGRGCATTTSRLFTEDRARPRGPGHRRDADGTGGWTPERDPVGTEAGCGKAEFRQM